MDYRHVAWCVAAALALAACGGDDDDDDDGSAGQEQTPQSEFDGHPLCQADGVFGDYACQEAGYEVPDYSGLPVVMERTSRCETVSGESVEAVEIVYGDLASEYFVAQAHPDCPSEIHLVMRAVGSSVLGTYYDFNKNGVFEARWLDDSVDTLTVFPVPDC